MQMFKKIMLLLLLAGSTSSMVFGMKKSGQESADGESPDVQVVCCICQDEIYPAHAIAITPCNHIFHASCLNKSLCLRRTCPLCRADLTEFMTPEHREAQRRYETACREEQISRDHEIAMREGAVAPRVPAAWHDGGPYLALKYGIECLIISLNEFFALIHGEDADHSPVDHTGE
ncbi:MAG: RING finger domain-containing protein [Candidatus Babeliales bacterium]|jgi:hypothetical protein